MYGNRLFSPPLISPYLDRLAQIVDYALLAHLLYDCSFVNVATRCQETGVNQKLGVISSPKRFRITEGEMLFEKITLR